MRFNICLNIKIHISDIAKIYVDGPYEYYFSLLLENNENILTADNIDLSNLGYVETYDDNVP